DLLRELTQASPAALLVDDLHQADPATLELVRALVAGGSSGQALLVLTARDPAPDDGSLAAEGLRQLAASPEVVRLELGRLSRQATATLLASMVGARAGGLPDDFVE